MCEGPLLLRDEANHRCICTELSHIFAHVCCLNHIDTKSVHFLHPFKSSLINSSLDRNERRGTQRTLLQTWNYCFFNLVPAGGKTHWPQFNSPIQSLHRQFCRIEVAQTIKFLRIRASFNPMCKVSLCQKAP